MLQTEMFVSVHSERAPVTDSYDRPRELTDSL